MGQMSSVAEAGETRRGNLVTLNIQQSVIFALSKANQRCCAVFKEEFRGHGLTPPQFIVLSVLWKTDGLSTPALSKSTGIDRSTMAGIIDRLQGAGLLVREPSADDRRSHRIMLTGLGRNLQEELCEAVSRVRRKISERISPAEYRELKVLLNKLFR